MINVESTVSLAPVRLKIEMIDYDIFIPCHTIVAGYYGFTLDVCAGPSVRFSFPDDNLSKRQWIFTKLGMCIGIVEIWFGMAYGQIASVFEELSACDTIMARYYSLTFLLLL